MRYRTNDPEPGPDVDVLINEQRGQTPYLARLQHGWVWVAGKHILDRDKEHTPTPLTWSFATAADGAPTELRTLNDAERADWLGS